MSLYTNSKPKYCSSGEVKRHHLSHSQFLGDAIDDPHKTKVLSLPCSTPQLQLPNDIPLRTEIQRALKQQYKHQTVPTFPSIEVPDTRHLVHHIGCVLR